MWNAGLAVPDILLIHAHVCWAPPDERPISQGFSKLSGVCNSPSLGQIRPHNTCFAVFWCNQKVAEDPCRRRAEDCFESTVSKLTEFCGKLSEFCEELGEFALADK